MYALHLDENNRIQCAGIYHKRIPADAVLVETLPDGDVTEYRYVDGEFIHDPLPETEPPEVVHEPTADDILNTLLGVTE